MSAAPHTADPLLAELALETGSMRDYERLAAFHYKGARPGAPTAVYRLIHRAPSVVGRYLHRREEVAIAGVLVRTLPHLSCRVRDEATNHRYRGLGAQHSAAVLNREVRTIARVVVHPQWRGLGLAAMLVQHALANPEPGQVFTEALAAMGRVHPFFEKAGMMRYDRPPRPEHARLLDALRRLGIDPVTLASPRMMLNELAKRTEHDQVWFEHELARWHRSGARRKRGRSIEHDLESMLSAARDQLLCTPVYYLYSHARCAKQLEPQMNADE
jgi:GNAT superfamily N-acetyltransferase